MIEHEEVYYRLYVRGSMKSVVSPAFRTTSLANCDSKEDFIFIICIQYLISESISLNECLSQH